MNFAPYIPLAGFFVNVFFALFVFTRAPRATANRIYLLLGLSIAVWNLGSYFLFVVTDHDSALFWARFLQFGCIFGVVAFFHLALIIAGFKVGRWIWWLYGLEVILAATNFTPLFIRDVRNLGTSGWYAQAGPAFHVFNVPFMLMFGSIFVLLKRYQTLPRVQRRRLLPMIWAEALLSVFGTNDVLPIVGIEHYPIIGIQVYPWGSMAAVFYGIIVAYSVLHFQLLDVQVGIGRWAAHFIRFALLFSITVGLLLTAALLSGNAFNATSFSLAMIVFVISTISASLLFPRLFGGKGVEKLERRIMGDRFEYEDQVRSFMENMAWYHDLNSLFNDLHQLFTGVFGLGSYRIILRDETNRVFSLHRAHPEEALRQLPELKPQSPIFRFFELGKSEYIALNPAYLRPAASHLERQTLEQLSEFNSQFCFPLASQNETFGLLLVGEKTSREPFTATDITLLVDLVKNMSLMVNQIRLHDQVLQNQELDLLGRMSRGMAHDLNNLLTPVWTLLQLAHEADAAGGPPTFDEELLPAALRNLKSMRAYIKEALFFSEHLRPDFQLGRLDLVVNQAADLAVTSRNKPVEVVTVLPEEVLAELDEVLVQRFIANIIANAIDASPEGATIRVELERLTRTEADREWLRLRVIDQGEGIPKEDLNRVFTPYFTTKNHGDETRGFGLGLAICRKIVNLHGGNLSIQSIHRRGTTVQIDLPSRQRKAVTPHIVQAA